MQEYKVNAMVHSQEEKGVQKVIIVSKPIQNSNEYIVTTSDGVKCHAIYNAFTNLYYADDVYGVIKEGN